MALYGVKYTRLEVPPSLPYKLTKRLTLVLLEKTDLDGEILLTSNEFLIAQNNFYNNLSPKFECERTIRQLLKYYEIVFKNRPNNQIPPKHLMDHYSQIMSELALSGDCYYCIMLYLETLKLLKIHPLNYCQYVQNPSIFNSYIDKGKQIINISSWSNVPLIVPTMPSMYLSSTVIHVDSAIANALDE